MAEYVNNLIKMNEANKKRFRELYGVADESAEFSFEMVIPSPKTEAECPSRYKPSSGSEELPERPWFNWYDWNLDHWGVKWDAGETSGPIGDLSSDMGLDFETPWDPPIPVYKKMAQGGLEFRFRWYGPRIDLDCGCGEAKGGKIRIAFDLAHLVEWTSGKNVGERQLGEPDWEHRDFMDEFGNFGEFDGTSFMVRTTGFWDKKTYCYPVQLALADEDSAPRDIEKVPPPYADWWNENHENAIGKKDYDKLFISDDKGNIFFLLDKYGKRIKSLRDFDHSEPDGDGNVFYPVPARDFSRGRPQDCTIIGGCGGLTKRAVEKWRAKLHLENDLDE